MPGPVEFLFDFVSPTSFLAYKRLPGIAERTGAEVKLVPIFLGGVMKATGNSPPFMVPAKALYMRQDLQRFADHDGVPLQFNPHFPINTMPLLRIAAGLQDDERFASYVDAVFDAMWLNAVNMGHLSAAAEALNAAGLNAAELFPLAESLEAKERLRANTEYAVSKGVFGSPSFIVGDHLLFGQDRTDWVERLAS